MLNGIKFFLIIITINSAQIVADENPIKLITTPKQDIHLSKKKNKKSYKNIKKICKNAKRKIITLESQSRNKSTPRIQRCKRAYSELRYQACHLRKYNQRKIDAAKSCGR